MRDEVEISSRIDGILVEIESIKANEHRDNYLIYSDEMKKKYKLFDELANLYWVLDENIPRDVFEAL